MRRLLALALLTGCSSSLPPVTTPVTPQSPESVQVEAVIAAWNERTDLPALDAGRLRSVMVTDAEDFGALCPSYARGCSIWFGACGGPVCERNTPLAVVRPGLEAGTRLSVIRHEMVHHAAAIAGMGPDAVHLDRRLWPYECGQDLACRSPTVEERARAIAGGAP